MPQTLRLPPGLGVTAPTLRKCVWRQQFWSPHLSASVRPKTLSFAAIYLLSLLCWHTTQCGPVTLSFTSFFPWWLILCQLAWARGCPDNLVKCYFWVSVRMFPAEISIWVGGLRIKQIARCMWVNIVWPTENLNRAKEAGRGSWSIFQPMPF